MTKLKGKAKARYSKKQKNKNKNDFFIRRKRLLAEILKYDNPILEVKCETVLPEEKDKVVDIFKKMKQVLNVTENGVGLAASQIGITKRIIIIKSDSKSKEITCMINPEIISNSDEMKYGKEGCLSYPDTYAFIERYTSITVKYLDEDFKEHEIEYKEGNILGIIVQHEMEHLEEGHCQVHDWWENPKYMEEILQEKLNPSKEEKYDVVESEDLKKEKEETIKKEPNKETKKAIEELEAGEGIHCENVDDFFEKMKEDNI